MMNLKQIAEEAHKIALIKEQKRSVEDDVQAQALIATLMKKLQSELQKMGYKTYKSQTQSPNMGTRYFIDVE